MTAAKDNFNRRDQQVVREAVQAMSAQMKTFGEQHNPDLYAQGSRFAVERIKHITDNQILVNRLTWQQILDEEMVKAYSADDLSELHEQLVQVAAVALSWARDIVRRGEDTDILILPGAKGVVT